MFLYTMLSSLYYTFIIFFFVSSVWEWPYYGASIIFNLNVCFSNVRMLSSFLVRDGFFPYFLVLQFYWRYLRFYWKHLYIPLYVSLYVYWVTELSLKNLQNLAILFLSKQVVTLIILNQKERSVKKS